MESCQSIIAVIEKGDQLLVQVREVIIVGQVSRKLGGRECDEVVGIRGSTDRLSQDGSHDSDQRHQ